MPFTGDSLAAGVPAASRRFHTPIAVVQGVEDGHTPGGGSLLEVTSGSVAVTAVKRHEVRDTLVIRMVNLATETTEATLAFARAPASVWRSNALEERGEPLDPAGPRLDVKLRAHEIFTLEAAFPG